MKGKVFKLGFAINFQTPLFYLSPLLEHVYAQQISGVSKCSAVQQDETACLAFKSIWFKSLKNM